MGLPTVYEMAAELFAFASEQYLRCASTHQIKAALKRASELFTTLRKEEEPEEKKSETKEQITLFKDCAYNTLKEELTKEDSINKNDISVPNVSYETPVNEPIIKDENKIYGPSVEVKKVRKPRSDKGGKRKKKEGANNAQEDK